jgi:hypothetical protein
LIARIVRDMAPTVITLLHATFDAPRSWLKAVCEDLEFVSTCSSGIRSLSQLGFRGWVEYFQQNGVRGVMAIRKACSEPGCNHIEQTCLPHHTANDEQYVCNVCGDIWASKQQLGVHLFKAHNRGHEIRRFIAYPTSHCVHCLLEKHTRQGLVEHLSDPRNAACHHYVIQNTVPASLRESRTWNLLARGEPDRRKHGRIPAFRKCGPVFPGVFRPGVKHMALKL